MRHEEFQDFNSPPNNMRLIRAEKCDGRDMCHVWKTREVHTGLWWGDLRERTTWKTWHRREDNNKIDIQEVGWGDMDWIGSGNGHVAGVCEWGNEPSGSIKCEKGPVTFSGRIPPRFHWVLANTEALSTPWNEFSFPCWYHEERLESFLLLSPVRRDFARVFWSPWRVLTMDDPNRN